MAVERYRGAASITADGALFRRMRKRDKGTEERLTTVSARRIIKARSEKVGFNRVSGHSMRLGSAVSLGEVGASARFFLQLISGFPHELCLAPPAELGFAPSVQRLQPASAQFQRVIAGNGLRHRPIAPQSGRGRSVLFQRLRRFSA